MTDHDTTDTDGTDLPVSRRGVLAALVGGGGLAAIASAQVPTEPDSLGVGGQPGVLAVGPDETYVIASGDTERYRAAHIASGGELVIDGTLEL